MIALEVDAAEFERAARALGPRNVDRVTGPIARRSIRQGTNAVRRRVRGEAPRVTGRLRGHVRTRFRGRGWAAQSIVYAGGSVAHLIILGTAEHRIPREGSGIRGVPIVEPLPGAVETFTGPFVRRASPPNPFFARGADAAQPELEAVQSAAVDDFAAALAAAIGQGG